MKKLRSLKELNRVEKKAIIGGTFSNGESTSAVIGDGFFIVKKPIIR